METRKIKSGSKIDNPFEHVKGNFISWSNRFSKKVESDKNPDNWGQEQKLTMLRHDLLKSLIATSLIVLTIIVIYSRLRS